MNAAPAAPELRELLSEACAIVRETRSVIEAALARGFSYRTKADGSFVTDADFAVETKARMLLSSRFPAHRIIGEELPENGDHESSGGREFTWVIDPIDGTKSFRHGVPLYGTLLALLHGDDPILGVIDLPGLDRTYSAARGLGARCNGRVVALQDLPGGGTQERETAPKDLPGDGALEQERALEKEIIGIGDRQQFVSAGRAAVFDMLMRAHPAVRTYTDCFGHALALDGAVGAMVDFDLRLWDTVASKVLMEEAGGRYVCFERAGHVAHDPREHRFDVVLGKPRVVDWILDRITAEEGCRGT